MHSRISDTYLLLLLPFDTRGKKRAGISRIVRTHNRLVVVRNDESELRRFPARNIFQDSRPR